MKLPHLVFDYDDTIVDTQHSLHEYALYTYPLTPWEDMPIDKYASTWKIFNDNAGFRRFLEGFAESEYFMHIKPIPGMLEELHDLERDGYPISILSAIGTTATKNRKEHFKIISNKLEIKDLICIPPATSKVAMLKKMGAVVFVDDGVPYIGDAIKVNSVKLPIIFTRPMNAHYIEAIRSGNYEVSTAGPTGFRHTDLEAVAKYAKIANNPKEIAREIRALAQQQKVV